MAVGGYRNLRHRRCHVRRFRSGSEELVDLVGVKACEFQVVAGGVEILEFEREQFLVPFGPGHRAVDQQPKRFHLRLAPFIAQDNRQVREAELPRRLDSQVAVDDFTRRARQHRNLETEFLNAAAHAVHGVVVLARVAGVQHQPINRPRLGFHYGCHGKGTPKTNSWCAKIRRARAF
jgi:hypothetical protein